MNLHVTSETDPVRECVRGCGWCRLAIFLLAVVVVGIALRSLQWRSAPSQVVRERLIMGTTCRLIAVGPRDVAESALDQAWHEVEAVNATMSTYDPKSELSRFNAAAAEIDVPLSPGLIAVLRLSQSAAVETRGAFDVSVLPLIRLWHKAAREGIEPMEEEIQAVLQKIGSTNFTVHESTARKHIAGLELTLDGIAPGYAVQQAIEILQTAGLSGGLIDLGGDIACFGKPKDSDAWQVAIQDPWHDGHLGILPLCPSPGTISAISTSGNYRRYLEIGGRRYSHILDPSTGLPAAQATSVTVLTVDAVGADIWATALSVLGPQAGLLLCESDQSMVALFVSGTETSPRFARTPGFPEFQVREQNSP